MKKYNLLVPLAGRGSRMIPGGYIVPKPMITAGDKTILDWSMNSVDYSECNIIFIILKEQAYNFSLDSILQSRYPESQVIQLDDVTRGAVETCYKAGHLIDNDMPLVILCSDIYFEPKYVPSPEHFETDGYLLTFKANSTNYSYVQKDADGFVSETKEKVVISQDAAVGVYCFKTSSTFLKYAAQMLADDIRTNGEFFLCPLYNLLISDGLKVASAEIDLIYIMGTAAELEFFELSIFPYFHGPTEFVLCADHSGFEAKEMFKAELLRRKLRFLDCGCASTKDCDYYDFLQLTVKRLQYTTGAFGIGFCRSGQGMNIAANKAPGIRAALVVDDEFAGLAIEHNAANFFSIPAGHVDQNSMGRIIERLVASRFEGGRHQNRLQKIG
jgi:RpiB/LacA/LacB family sugar-phosphate isomerase